MNSSIKQVYVSIQIDQNEIKLLAGEYFHTRFNIIQSEKYHTDAIVGFNVLDDVMLTEDIKKAVKDFSNRIGGTVLKVILVVPAYNFKRISLKSRIYPENGVISKKDIARAVSNSLNTKVDNDVLIVNSLITKYTVNGLSTKRIPENEVSDDVVVDLDLLCADKQMIFDYVTAIEKAGIEVLDITLNTYCICKEASLFEESLKNILILMDVERNVTYLSLLSKGKLVSTEVIFDGLVSIGEGIKKTYQISDNDLYKLIKYNINYECDNPNDVIYAISNDNNTITISTKQLNDVSSPFVDELSSKLIDMCLPLLESGANIVVTGEGMRCKALVNEINQKSNNVTRKYYPETIGVRDPSLSALYGSFIVYKEKANLNDIKVECIDLLEFDTSMNDKKFDDEGETITTKIKNLFKQYMKGEE